jgi:aminoglycoside phosphotransferase (APT) family kinase protein
VRYQCIDRAADAFQQPIDAEVIIALCRRAFGADADVREVVELPWGSYNNAYRVVFAAGAPVVLRVAPEPARQFAVERGMLRNEYAAAPYLAPIADVLPRPLFADFTHQLLPRDYLFQSLLRGLPAPEGMRRYPRPQWASFFGQIGALARQLHDVRGPGFGPIAGPWFDTWTESLVDYFACAATDIDRSGYDADDVREMADICRASRDELDPGTEPRLLHGDGWTANFLVDPETPELTVTGACDWDRARWGDPLSDFAIQRALQRPGTERDTFWVGYGNPRPSVDGRRQLIYQARFVVELRLDYIRSRQADKIAASHDELTALCGRLRVDAGRSVR